MKITFRDYQRSDLLRLIALLDNPKVSQYLATVPYPYTQQDGEWWLDVGAKSPEDITQVIENDKGEFVGAIAIRKGGGIKQHQAEIGYWIGEPYWRQTIASSAVQQFSDYCMKELGYKKLFAGVFEPNKGSMKVLEKCGYKLEAILKKGVCKDGKYYDEYFYSLMAPDIDLK